MQFCLHAAVGVKFSVPSHTSPPRRASCCITCEHAATTRVPRKCLNRRVENKLPARTLVLLKSTRSSQQDQERGQGLTNMLNSLKSQWTRPRKARSPSMSISCMYTAPGSASFTWSGHNHLNHTIRGHLICQRNVMPRLLPINVPLYDTTFPIQVPCVHMFLHARGMHTACRHMRQLMHDRQPCARTCMRCACTWDG